jgi:protein-S-isoprenylcysteine O-methyltransferase Ste14
VPEWVFRVTAFVLLLVYRIIRKVWEHRLAAHLKEPPTIVRKSLRERGLLGVMGVLMIPAFIWFFGPWIDFAHVPVPEWSRWAGAVVCALGIWYFAETHRALAHNWSPLLEVREGNSLITSGPYRLVRHPMYSAGLVVNVGAAMVSANWIVAFGLLAGLILICIVRIPDEERMMLDVFGDEYRAYIGRTGRIMPRFSAVMGHDPTPGA